MTTDSDLTALKKDLKFLTLLNFRKSDMFDKNNRVTSSYVWVNVARKVKLDRFWELFSIYFSKTTTHHNGHLLEQHSNLGIKEDLHHYSQHTKCHHCYTSQHPTHTVWFMYFLIISLFLLSKVSALQDRRVIVEPWPRVKTVSSTNSLISGLSSGSPIVTREHFDRRPLDEDINRLVDRSEDIIRIQDEEEPRMTQSKRKPVRKTKDFRCPLPSFLEHGFVEGKDSRIGDTMYFRCKPGYKLIGPSQITCKAKHYLYRTVVEWDSAEKRFCKKNLSSQRHPYYLTDSRSQSMLIFWENIFPWKFHSMQLKPMSNAVYRCRFPKQKGFCRGLVPHYYFNIRRLKCEIYRFGTCHDRANQFKTIKECQQICSSLIYQ